jgi:hypothetical protein
MDKNEKKAENKLVTLPNEVWDELRNRGYYIPKKGVEYNPMSAIKKLSFQELVYNISSSQKRILLYTLLNNLDPKRLNTDTIANLAICADENNLINTANNLAEIFNYLIIKEKETAASNNVTKQQYTTSKIEKAL